MGLPIIISFLLIICSITKSFQQVQRCLLNRDDYLPCKYKSSAIRAGVNEYSVHSTKLRPNSEGVLECLVKPNGPEVRPISTYNGTEDIKYIFSPGYIAGERYPNQIRAEYNVQCPENKLIFYNISHLDLQGKEDCQDEEGNFRCQDYIIIKSEGSGVRELCGSLSSNSELSAILSNSMNVVFRSSEEQRFTGFFMLVLCVPSECALNECQGSFDLNCFCQCTICPAEFLNTPTTQDIPTPQLPGTDTPVPHKPTSFSPTPPVTEVPTDSESSGMIAVYAGVGGAVGVMLIALIIIIPVVIVVVNKCKVKRELKSENNVANTVEEVQVSAAPDGQNAIYEEIPSDVECDTTENVAYHACAADDNEAYHASEADYNEYYVLCPSGETLTDGVGDPNNAVMEWVIVPLQ